MKTIILVIISFLFASQGSGQSSKSVGHRINAQGLGYGIEVITSPQLSFTGEIGLSPWENLGDRLIDEKDRNNKGMANINPYANVSVRYYFKALSAQDRLSQESNNCWYVSAA